MLPEIDDVSILDLVKKDLGSEEGIPRLLGQSASFVLFSSDDSHEHENLLHRGNSLVQIARKSWYG